MATSTHTALWTDYKNKARLGPAMQEMSVRHCAQFAKTYNYFFYAGQDGMLEPKQA